MKDRTLAIISIVLGIAGIGLAIYLSNKSNTTTTSSQTSGLGLNSGGNTASTAGTFGNPLTSDTGMGFNAAEQEQYKQELAAGFDVTTD